MAPEKWNKRRRAVREIREELAETDVVVEYDVGLRDTGSISGALSLAIAGDYSEFNDLLALRNPPIRICWIAPLMGARVVEDGDQRRPVFARVGIVE